MDNEQLVIETLKEAREYVDRFLRGLEMIVESFLKGREDVALNEYPHLVEGIEWLVNVLTLTEEYSTAKGVSFVIDEKINQVLQESVEALENRDYVLVGDLLNYEIKPIVEEWQKNLILLCNRMD